MQTPLDRPSESSETEQAVHIWLQQNAIPIHHVKAGNGFADLQPLKQLLQDVKLVGLGETTHGTREFFQLKHRLIEFLVTEMHFTLFAIEASVAACQPINEYVLYGKGDRAMALTGQWYVLWDTEEVSALLDWLRMYNQGVPDEQKVMFQGVDVTRNAIGVEAVLDYIHRVDADNVAATEPLLAAFASEDAKWPGGIDEAAQKTLVQLLPQIQTLIDHFTTNKDPFVARSSLREYDQALLYTRVMQQFILQMASDLLPPAQAKGTDRSASMAKNIITLLSWARPDTKCIYWGHNGHVGVGDTTNEDPNLGAYLRAHYGRGYFAFGFEFNQGSFQTRTRLPDNRAGDLKEVTLPPAPAHSLSWYLSHINLAVCIVNLRVPVNNPLVAQWLAIHQPIHMVYWGYRAEPPDYLELSSVQAYDGIVFIERTTASRPTVNARKMIADHKGL